MAQALRHKPARFGIELDEDGWTAVSDLLLGLRRRTVWPDLTEADLECVLALPGKQRYEMKDCRIRALYGHSAHVGVVKRTAIPPPSILYHGTAPETAVIILRGGLKPMRRRYVHLSTDIETAKIVGQRKDNQPVIFRVRALAAYETAVNFYPGNDSTWLADPIPPEFLEVLEQ